MLNLRLTAGWVFAGGFLIASLLIATSDGAFAQERTTATYDDWVLQCAAQAGPPAQKTCDIEQLTQMQTQGRNVPLSRVAIGRPEKGQPARLTIQVPVNVYLRTEVRVQSSTSDPGLAAPFDRCLPVGCFADFVLKDDAIKKFRAATAAGKMSFQSANGQNVAIPLSFKGFGPAFDALLKQ
jgi:invasion protein IalB